MRNIFKKHNKAVIFDLETSGLNFRKDKILELGYLIIEKGKIIEENSHVINWGIEIPKIITSLTGITQEEVEFDGITPKELLKIVITVLKKAGILISHNEKFDVSFLHSFLLSMGIEGGIESFNLDYLDSLTVVADFIPKGKNPRKPRSNAKEYDKKMEEYKEKLAKVQSHKVMSVCDYYGIELKGAHRAMADIKAVYYILQAFCKKEKDVDLSFYINKWGYNRRWGIDELCFYPARISLYSQGNNGERYILNMDEEKLFE